MVPGDVVKLRNGSLRETWIIEKIKSTAAGLWVVFQNAPTAVHDEVWHNAEHYEVV